MAMKVMQKRYRLVNQSTNKEMIVFPERACGLNRDGHRKTNKEGFRQRIFKVIDAQGVDLSIFDVPTARPDERVQADEVVLYNKGGSYPTVEVDNEVWELVCIDGERAPKPRDKSKKQVVATATP